MSFIALCRWKVNLYILFQLWPNILLTSGQGGNAIAFIQVLPRCSRSKSKFAFPQLLVAGHFANLNAHMIFIARVAGLSD